MAKTKKKNIKKNIKKKRIKTRTEIKPKPATITLMVGKRKIKMIHIAENGSIYVKGKIKAMDKYFYMEFARLLRNSGRFKDFPIEFHNVKDIIFQNAKDKEPILVLSASGDFFSKGKIVEHDNVYKMLIKFMTRSGYMQLRKNKIKRFFAWLAK